MKISIVSSLFDIAGLITRLLELARDEDLGIGGNPGDEDVTFQVFFLLVDSRNCQAT